MLRRLGIGALVVLGGAALVGRAVHGRDTAQAERVGGALLALRDPAPTRFDPADLAGAPEVARRYLARAIAPGTPLHRMVRLEMAGTFTMNGRAMAMQARQILAPPGQGFVWQAEIGAGAMLFAGSDGYMAGAAGVESWTKFWLRGLLPLARIGGTDDHARAAATRAMLESIWVPAALLPQNGADWVQTGPDSAEIRFAAAPGLSPMHLTLDAAGDVTEVWALRWTDANPKRVFRLQPFGGRMLAWGAFAGFRIPVRVELGNQWRTPDEVLFFDATITRAEY
jgi:hypothetical protein